MDIDNIDIYRERERDLMSYNLSIIFMVSHLKRIETLLEPRVLLAHYKCSMNIC